MHTIRLTRAWEVEPGDPVRLLRPFHWVAPHIAGERIELVIGTAPCDVVIFLNDTRLGNVSPADVPARFDVTQRLEPSNRLVVEISGREPSPENGDGFGIELQITEPQGGAGGQ